MHVSPEPKRIQILDGFRCLAVLLVILIHLGTSYTSYYPYGKQLTSNIIIANGHLGVHLFFMISGFVIFMTLERCNNFFEFLIKRIVRLLPTLLFCSIVTFLVFRIFDAEHRFAHFHNALIDFVPSLTFSDLWIWNIIFHRQMEYIDGVYWTLSYEMKFYLISATIYYLNKNDFFKNWLRYVCLVLASYLCVTYFLPGATELRKLIKLCLFPEYVVLFTLGMYFYLLYSKRKLDKLVLPLLVALTLVEMYITNHVLANTYILIFIGMFACFVYKPTWISIISNRVFIAIGLISYPLYLIHSHIGVFLITQISVSSGLLNPYVLIILSTLTVMVIAYIIHHYIEKPSNRLIRKYLFRQPKRPVLQASDINTKA